MNEMEVLSNDLAQALVLARLVVIPLDWSAWPVHKRFGWLSEVCRLAQRAILEEK